MINTRYSQEGRPHEERRYSQRPATVYNVVSKNTQGKAQYATDGVIVTRDGDKYTIDKPFIYWCGCYGASRKITEAFRGIGLNEHKVPRTKETNRPVKEWIRQHEMELKYPGMQAGQFAYLVDPANLRAVNLYKPAPDCGAQMKEILKPYGYEFGQN